MMYNPETKREFHITFYNGYRKVLGTTTVVATVYTIHEILAEKALRLLPGKVARDYNRYSVLQGNFI